MRFFVLIACLLLAGCKIETNPNAPPTPQAEDSVLPQRGGFCFPCYGPHLRLDGSGFSFLPSLAPGIEF